jgi:hypothetical protein
MHRIRIPLPSGAVVELPFEQLLGYATLHDEGFHLDREAGAITQMPTGLLVCRGRINGRRVVAAIKLDGTTEVSDPPDPDLGFAPERVREESALRRGFRRGDPRLN